MSNPVSDLKRELLAAAEREYRRVAVGTGRTRLQARLARHRILLTSAILAIAAVVSVVVSAPWSNSPGFLERAQAALTPDAETVLHQKWEVTSSSTDPACAVTHGPNEIWIDQTSPHRYRALLNFPPEPKKVDPRAPCRGGRPYELGGTFATGAISLFGGTNLSVLDPVTELREAISAGTAHDEGKTQLDGRTVERIRIDLPPSACPNSNCPREPAYAYVDPDTFFPVEMHGSVFFGPPAGPVVLVRLVMRIVRFEYLPRTAANLALTNIRAQQPNAAGP
jgi:hypothetical protein